MVTAPESSLLSMVCFISECRRSTRSDEKPATSGLTTVISSLWLGAGSCARHGHANERRVRISTANRFDFMVYLRMLDDPRPQAFPQLSRKPYEPPPL